MFSKPYRWKDYKLDSCAPSGFTEPRVQMGAPKIPEKFDMREDFGPVQDQEWLPDDSVAFAVTAVAEYILRKQPLKGSWSSLSVLYTHQQAMVISNRLSYPRVGLQHGIAALIGLGARRESDWPSTKERISTLPPFKFEAPSINFARPDQANVYAGDDGVAQTLHGGQPVLINYIGPPEFMKIAGQKGAMPDRPGKAVHGDPAGHAMVVVGYDLKAAELIVRNSFGADWGEDGYFRMPMAVFKAHVAKVSALGPYGDGTMTRRMSETYPGEKDQDASHRKHLDALLGSGEGESDSDRNHRACIDMLISAGLPALKEAAAGQRLSGGDKGRDADTSAAPSRFGSQRSGLREELQDSSSEAARDFRSRLRKQEDEIASKPPRGGGDDQGR